MQNKKKMSDSDDDLPLATRAPAQTTYEHVDSDDDVPLGTRIPVASSTKANPKLKSAANKSTRKRKTRDVEHDSSSGDEPIGSLVGLTGRKSSSSGLSAKKRAKRADDEPWRAKKGAKKMWSTLEHNGVVFPPPYEAHGIPLVYDGHDVKLLPLSLIHI